MQLILKENIKGLGEMGDSVRVKDGYARNFLLPQKLAMAATDENLKIILKQKKAARAKEEQKKKAAEAFAQKISALSYTIVVAAGEDEKLFGSVTAADIKGALAGEGMEVDKKQIDLEEPIKQLGIYDVPVKIMTDVAANAKIFVVKK